MGSVLREILNEVNAYIADSGVWILYLTSLFVIYRGNDEMGKKNIVKPMLLIMFIIFNPVAALIFDKCLDSSYWRVLWMLAEPIVIAYAFVVILRNFKRVKKFIVGVLFCIIVTLVGRNMYRDTQLVFAENAYKIPNEMIEISQLVTNAECEPCVVAVDTIPIWIRQYDASIDMLYGRYGESELRALVNDASRDYEKLYDILSKRECNILIIRNNEISNEEIYQYGFEYIGCTEHYALYKLV